MRLLAVGWASAPSAQHFEVKPFAFTVGEVPDENLSSPGMFAPRFCIAGLCEVLG